MRWSSLASLLLALGAAAPASAQGVHVWHPGGGRPIVQPALPAMPAAPGGVVTHPSQLPPPRRVDLRAPVLRPVVRPIARPTPVVRPVVQPVVRPVIVQPPRVTPAARARLRAQLAARRARNLRRLAAYAAAGAFPDNHLRPGRQNVLIDDEDRFCAVAHLMRLDGLEGPLRAAARRDNGLRFRDVRQGAFHEWMLQSGLTREELDAVQEPYDFIPPDEPPVRIRQREDRERQRLQAHFRRLLAELRADPASLDRATERLIGWRLAWGVPPTAPLR